MIQIPERVGTVIKTIERRAGIVGLAIVCFVLGFLLHAALTPDSTLSTPSGEACPDETTEAPTLWTCAMHPEIRRSKPGKCPLCSMDLTPVSEAGMKQESDESSHFVTSKAAMALMDIETSRVERKFVATEVRMVGKVDYDETRLATISAWVSGRLDRLYVDYTGIPVRQGDHLVSIYSPELLSAQEELIQAIAAIPAIKRSDSDFLREATQATLEATRDKLRLLGLTAKQIARVEQSGKATDHLTIFSPSSGIVIQKDAKEGDYVRTGTRIYTIADLSRVWVRLDAYESDLASLRYGQTAELTTVSYPGETFEGTVSFIDPVLDAATRTVKVRLNVPNGEGRLKPGMFVKAIVRSKLTADGRVANAALAGKWISPMHPEIVRDAPGVCDVCGMPLVTAESLGYVDADTAGAKAPLVIPASAPLKTGTRAVVYVKVPDADKPTFELREVKLGPLAGRHYLVRSGLAEGERVVTRGNFKIDSALQLAAKPSMMSRKGETTEGHAPKAGGHGHD
jgi:membrane fusion protein, copper/silver efflux system